MTNPTRSNRFTIELNLRNTNNFSGESCPKRLDIAASLTPEAKILSDYDPAKRGKHLGEKYHKITRKKVANHTEIESDNRYPRQPLDVSDRGKIMSPRIDNHERTA
ncbi:MAG TPA: hypothetical protein PK765_03805 [bacterium]|nr:hypothetical protein [bacterium]